MLEHYMRANVLNGAEFCCPHYKECRGSRKDFPYYEGQLSHVGRHYDLEVSGRPMRIVVVGQEYGTGERRMGLGQRSKMLEKKSALVGFRGRNKHMKGTTSTLRLLLGRKLGTDAEGERLLNGHIFDGFALVNYLLCSALEEERGEYRNGAGRGNSSPTMRQNCGRHFLRTLEILEPTIIVIQGQGVRRWVARTLGIPLSGPVAEKVTIAGSKVDMLTFNHPSARGYDGYGSHDALYLRDTIVPTIRRWKASVARRR
jgi:hypothetical protein